VDASQWVPYTFFAYLTSLVTFLMVYGFYLRKDELAGDEDAYQVYGAEPTEMHSVKDLA